MSFSVFVFYVSSPRTRKQLSAALASQALQRTHGLDVNLLLAIEATKSMMDTALRILG